MQPAATTRFMLSFKTCLNRLAAQAGRDIVAMVGDLAAAAFVCASVLSFTTRLRDLAAQAGRDIVAMILKLWSGT